MNRIKLFGAAVIGLCCLCSGIASASGEVETGLTNPYVTTGARISPSTVVPTLRKWYLPQRLYQIYQWKAWEYTNYARTPYRRYVDIELEGERFYDMYGNYITKGWYLYGWTEEYPQDFGSGTYKDPYFSGWFDRLLISSTRKGQFHTALTLGESIRTTLTPLTFSKPRYDGLQWDFLTDKYACTVLASRINFPGTIAYTRGAASISMSTFTDMLGVRGIAQIGDFVKMGLTYLNASHRNSQLAMGDNSSKGLLSGGLNTGYVRTLTVRLSDDSPEDGEGGALLYREMIFIDGVEHPEIEPLKEGGVRHRGLIEASGSDVVTLTYDIEHDFRPGLEDKITDFREIHRIEVGLVLANDYKVESTSNMQTSALGEPVFLLVTRASDNVKDGSNQEYVRFLYGLPTGNQLAGLTLEVDDLAGFNFKGEYVSNSKFRRFPNQTYKIDQALATEHADAFYATASHFFYPWFAYGEVFSIDPGYSTSMFIPDSKAFVDYGNEQTSLYEFVDDNDDQDRYPDWTRRYTGATKYLTDPAVFPGLDENNDDISDFNQNGNAQPDYYEPFLRYDADPPEFLFGTDMNNNTVIDRFENDTEPDYPYKRDHRGYNAYVGAELFPGSRCMVGRLGERLISADRRSTVSYALFTFKKDFPMQALSVQFMGFPRIVRDDIPDDIILWVQTPFSSGKMQDFSDPLIAQNTFINTTYLEVGYDRFMPFTNKFKYEVYHQRGGQAKGKRDRQFLGIINKADYPIRLKSLTLWPKWKQMYQNVTPTEPGALKIRELSEILSFLATYRISAGLSLISGAEYEIFNNLLEKPDPLPPEFVEDYERLTLAFQVSNASDYMGYSLTTNIGMHWERKSFETGSRTNTLTFVTFYAGAKD